jgi:hypothetical protein
MTTNDKAPSGADFDAFENPTHNLPDCYYWYWLGWQQGQREEKLSGQLERESLLQQIVTLSCSLGERTAKFVQGPSFAELQRRRFGGDSFGR